MAVRKAYGDGTIVTEKVTFTDPVTGAVIDPVVVSVVVRSPDGTKTTYVYGTDVQVVKASIGIYYVVTTFSQVGTYKWKWTGTGTQKGIVIYDECDSEKEAGF